MLSRKADDVDGSGFGEAEGAVARKGTAEAVAREHRKAVGQVRQKEEQLNGAQQGQFARDNKGTPMVNIKRGFESIAIPK